MADDSDSSRTGILRQVNAPLGFYVLALLVIEASLALVLSVADLETGQRWYGFLIMVAIFVIVLVLVSILVIWYPKNLVFGKEEHAAHTEPSALRDQIEDLIIETVKSDCLKDKQG